MTRTRRQLFCIVIMLVWAALSAHAGILRQGKTLLLCHRTANRDVPENTLESLALAARMGWRVQVTNAVAARLSNSP